MRAGEETTPIEIERPLLRVYPTTATIAYPASPTPLLFIPLFQLFPSLLSSMLPYIGATSDRLKSQNPSSSACQRMCRWPTRQKFSRATAAQLVGGFDGLFPSPTGGLPYGVHKPQDEDKTLPCVVYLV
jgi:hypothetical protein